MNFKAWLKRISAILLAACFFLPMSQCKSMAQTEHVDATGNTIADPTVWADLSPLYVYGDESLHLVLIVLLYSWPLIFQLFVFKWPALNEKYPFLLSELLLLTGTSYFTGQLILMGERIAYGAYVFIVSAAVYFVITIVDLLRKIALTTQSRGPA